MHAILDEDHDLSQDTRAPEVFQMAGSFHVKLTVGGWDI
jgi:hypothetical protein